MIVVAGEALIDLVLHPDGRVDALPGGGSFNTARTFGRLGGTVGFLGRLSTDRLGQELRQRLVADGVGVALPASPGSTPAFTQGESTRQQRLQTFRLWMSWSGCATASRRCSPANT